MFTQSIALRGGLAREYLGGKSSFFVDQHQGEYIAMRGIELLH
jgi:hypothetical protein